MMQCSVCYVGEGESSKKLLWTVDPQKQGILANASQLQKWWLPLEYSVLVMLYICCLFEAIVHFFFSIGFSFILNKESFLEMKNKWHALRGGGEKIRWREIEFLLLPHFYPKSIVRLFPPPPHFGITSGYKALLQQWGGGGRDGLKGSKAR